MPVSPLDYLKQKAMFLELSVKVKYSIFLMEAAAQLEATGYVKRKGFYL